MPPKIQSLLLLNEGLEDGVCCLRGFFNLHTCALGATEFYVLDVISQASGVLVTSCISQFKWEHVFSTEHAGAQALKHAPSHLLRTAVLIKVSIMPPPVIHLCPRVFGGCVLSCLRAELISFLSLHRA